MIVLPPSVDLQTYRTMLGRPLASLGLLCDGCGSEHLHAHGSYVRKAFVSREEGVTPLPIRRVRCAACDRAPSVVPAFASSGLWSEDAVVEDAAAHYLSGADSTYRAVAARFGLAHTTLWRWVGRLGGGALTCILGMLVRAQPDADPLVWLPKFVAAVDRKARSEARRGLLVDAFQVLIAARRLAESLLAGLAIRRPPTLAHAFGLTSHMRRNGL